MKHRIAAIPGDGIGKEVVPEGMRVLDAAGRRFGFEIEWTVRLSKGAKSPLAGRGPADIDMLIVRENNEGEYSEIGGRLYRGTPEELAVQQAVFTRKGCDRIMRYAFERAMKRPRRHVTSATKSNGIIQRLPIWSV